MAGETSFGISSPALGWGSLIAQGIGNTITALGSLTTTRYANRIANSQANIARINAAISKTNADTMERRYQAALFNGEAAATRQTMRAGSVRHSQRAAAAANGIAVGEGSAAEQQASTDLIKTMDRNSLVRAATSEAWGYRWEKLNYENQARAFQGQASAALASRQNAFVNFNTSLLGASTQTGVNYVRLANLGLFGSSSSRTGSSSGGVDAVSAASPVYQKF